MNSSAETMHDVVDFFRGTIDEEDTTEIAKTRMAKERRQYLERGRNASCPTRNTRGVLESYEETRPSIQNSIAWNNLSIGSRRWANIYLRRLHWVLHSCYNVTRCREIALARSWGRTYPMIPSKAAKTVAPCLTERKVHAIRTQRRYLHAQKKW